MTMSTTHGDLDGCPLDDDAPDPGIQVVRACACATCREGEACDASVIARYPLARPEDATARALIQAAHPGCDLVYA